MISLYERFRRLRDSFVACFEHGDWKTDDDQLTVHARRVLFDLKAFCRASETTVVVAKDGRIDVQATFVAEGRREALLRIQHYLDLSDTDLLKLVDPDEDRQPQRKEADHE